MFDILSGSELLLHFFPVFRVSRVVQIFVMEFSNNGTADLGNKFTDGGLANQPVILQGGVIWHPEILGCLCVLGQPGGCCSILFLVFEVSKA